MIRSHTTESKTKTNKGYEEHKLKLALQQSTSNSSKSSKNDSLKRPPSYNTVTGGTATTESGLGSGAQVISSREFDQMRRNSQSIGESGLIGQFRTFLGGQDRSSLEGQTELDPGVNFTIEHLTVKRFRDIIFSRFHNVSQ